MRTADIVLCRWCGEHWLTDGKHECGKPSTFTLPCYQCGGDVPTKPSGYGLSVDFLGPTVWVEHRGYSRNEVVCSEKCAALVKFRAET